MATKPHIKHISFEIVNYGFSNKLGSLVYENFNFLPIFCGPWPVVFPRSPLTEMTPYTPGATKFGELLSDSDMISDIFVDGFLFCFPGTQMSLILSGKGLWSPKIEDK